MNTRRQLATVACSALLVAMAFACGSFGGADAAPDTDSGIDALATGDGGPTEASRTDDSATSEGGAGPVEIARGLDDPEGIAVTESTVYVTEHTRGNVRSFSVQGGPYTDLVTNSGSPTGIAIAGGFVFWSDFGGAKVSGLSLDGGSTLSTTTSGKGPFAIAPASDRIVVMALAGSDVGEAQQYTFDLLAGPSVGPLANPFDVAVHEGSIYWTEASNGRIGRGQIGVATNGDFVTGEMDCQSIAADPDGVYWTRRASGLVRTKATGGAMTLASNEETPHSLVADTKSLYWLTGDGKLRGLSHGTGAAVRTIASGFGADFAQMRVRALAYNTLYLVWITTDGRVLRVPRP